ncbi:MAG: hypothetical protein IPM71_16285 [Bacteroidota bacterium]|nr:MAG: hypothetical protein IPM71_15475 [Bacteroidota bacterium]QQS51077.1 MAG: hypothetical protein IPM71_16185 [Bacteroidota bacterium]QQS51094.1 MAG: hypothetical protein IPM71_16285 [Bacteroidota bacterium]
MNFSKKISDLIYIDRYKFGPLVLFPMLGLMLIGFSFYKIEILIADLKDLSMIENRIYDTRIERNNFAIKLNDNKSEFFTDHTELENFLKPGEFIKIYYKKRIFFPKHLIIYQIEANGKILIAFEMKKKESLTIMIICFVLGFSFLGINYFYRKRVNK